jgi:hypothetical protein
MRRAGFGWQRAPKRTVALVAVASALSVSGSASSGTADFRVVGGTWFNGRTIIGPAFAYETSGASRGVTLSGPNEFDARLGGDGQHIPGTPDWRSLYWCRPPGCDQTSPGGEYSATDESGAAVSFSIDQSSTLGAVTIDRSNLTATPDRVAVRWSAPQAARSYFVYINEASKNESILPTIRGVVLPPGATSAEFTGLALDPNTRYQIDVFAFSGDITSASPLQSPFNISSDRFEFAPHIPPPTADVAVDITQEVLPTASSAPAPPAVPAGTSIRYQITVTNNGPGVAQDVLGNVAAPTDSRFDSVSADTGTCSGSTNITCVFGNLAVGQQAHLTTIATPARGRRATTTARVSARGPDAVAANNTASVSIDVAAATTLVDPTFGETVTPIVISGFVCAQLPNTSRCVDIATLAEVPVGSVVDARVGRVQLTVATAAGTFEQAELYEGIFQVLQAILAARASVTEFRLAGGDFSVCKVQRAKRTTRPAARKRKPARQADTKPGQPVRRLWGDAVGSFRSRGSYAMAGVRGTVWLTEDFCNGTLVRVREGSVTVRDLVKNRTVVLTAGQTYFAEAPAPKAGKAKPAPAAKSKPKKRKTAAAR